MNLAAHERETRRILTQARVDSPGLCARLLTAHAAGLDKMALILAHDQEMPQEGATRLADLTRRRASGEPLAYILGRKEFYGLEFQVTSATLVPRPETELLVDLALATLSPSDPVVMADLGCGSGCIGLAILHQRPRWQGLLLDNYPPALAVAQINAQNLGLKPQLLLADMFHPPLRPNSLNLLVSNPPYIGAGEWVMPETLAHEPHCALFSPANGTAHLKAVIAAARLSLKPGGLAIFEHGATQQEFMARSLARAGFTAIHEAKDLAGIERCAIARKGD